MDRVEEMARAYAEGLNWPNWESLAPGARAQATSVAKAMLEALDKELEEGINE